MALQSLIDRFFTTSETRATADLIRDHTKDCDTVLEFGCRGGMSGLLLIQGLLDAESKWPRRYVGVDLVEDESVKNLRGLATQNGLSFEFWCGHSKTYPLHETDGFCWDTFHCGGNLFDDLVRISPYVKKTIFVLGTRSHGTASQAVVRGLSITQVAKELQITEEGVKMGLKEGLRRVLATHPEWIEVAEVGEITVLRRVSPISISLFQA